MKDHERSLTQEKLKEILDYNSETGIFIWKVSLNRNNPNQKGSIAGRRKSNGYREISIDGYLYQAHRLAWFYVYGELPENEIDHKDCTPGNDWINNLRKATRTQNSQNRTVQANNKLGLKGVKRESLNSYSATIWLDRKPIYIGSFPTKEEAALAYENKAKELHGEFYKI